MPTTIRTVKSPDLKLVDKGTTLVDIRSKPQELITSANTARKEFKSLGGLKFLAAARALDFLSLDLTGGMVKAKPACELAIFAEVDGEWCLVDECHITLHAEDLQRASGQIISYIINTDIGLEQM